MERESIFDLSGRVALVTGGGSGLGKVFCESMAEFGADVACCDIIEDTAQETAELISRYGHKRQVIRADISQPDEVEYMVEQTVTKLGAIDILFNNAGIATVPTKIHEMSINDWDRVMAVNLRGVFLCTRAVLPVMINQKRGCIVNISSIAGIKAVNPRVLPQANYSAAKAGVVSLTRQAAMEYARDGIRVNCIVPGHHTGTRIAPLGPKWGKQELQRFEEMVARSNPMGRVGQPSELKGLAVYLASDASSYVTGQIFVQDGGASV